MGWLHDAPTCRASSTPAARLTGYHRFRAQGLQPGGGGSLDRLARRFCEHLQVQNHTGICLWLLAGQEQELRSGAVRGCPAHGTIPSYQWRRGSGYKIADVGLASL